jgi:hypothetical protein
MNPSERSTAERRIIGGCVVLLLTAIVLGSSSCAKSKNDNGSAAGSSGGGQTSAAADNSNTAPSQASTATGKPTTWETNVTVLAAKNGETFTLNCPPGGTAHSIWGSDVYTADSSICTAAVHSGLITIQQGGSVTVEVWPGRSLYGCSERNGVTSSSYGSYGQSFVFKTPNTEALLREADEQTPVLWSTSAGMVPFAVGKTYKFKCPAGGRESSVWGTDTYTSDSSICNAAVHAGKFTLASGGSVTIELQPGETAYTGSLRNGIKSNDYGKYPSSFVVK